MLLPGPVDRDRPFDGKVSWACEFACFPAVSCNRAKLEQRSGLTQSQIYIVNLHEEPVF